MENDQPPLVKELEEKIGKYSFAYVATIIQILLSVKVGWEIEKPINREVFKS